MIYDGEFAAGLFHGIGRRTVSSTGTVQEGRWHDGSFCGGGDKQTTEEVVENGSAASLWHTSDETSESNNDPPSTSRDTAGILKKVSDGLVALTVSKPLDEEEVVASGYVV
jgi:hypothetical protein